MSNPTPTPLPPTPVPVKAIDWAKLIALVSILLTQLGVLFVPDVPDDDKPTPTPVVVVDPVTPPAPAPTKTESAYVFDESGKRTDKPEIEAVALTLVPGRWRVVLIPEANGELKERWVTVSDGGPTPPVVVTPPVEPPVTPPVEPPVTPAPIPATGFRVLILEESGNRTPELASLVRTPEVETYLNTKTVKVDGFPEWRKLDDDYTEAQQARWSDIWKNAYAMAKKDSAAAGKLPWLLVSDGTKGESLSLVDATGKLMSKADFLTLLRKYGG